MTKRTGRPPLDPQDPSIRMGFRVSSKQYDALYVRAKDARMNVSEFIRDRLGLPILRSPHDTIRIRRN